MCSKTLYSFAYNPGISTPLPQATGDPADLARAEQVYDEFAGDLDYNG